MQKRAVGSGGQWGPRRPTSNCVLYMTTVDFIIILVDAIIIEKTPQEKYFRSARMRVYGP